jgi:hypothetical protein
MSRTFDSLPSSRVYETVVGESLGQGGNGPADLLDPVPKVLPAVTGNEHSGDLRPVSPHEKAQLFVNASAQRRIAGLGGDLHAEGVNHGVPRH